MEQLVEQFKAIDGYEEQYLISNCGYVISLAREWMCGRAIRKKPKTKLISTINQGYQLVCLCKSGNTKRFKLSILVWEAFGIRSHYKMHVHHIDRNKMNDRIDNLMLYVLDSRFIIYL